MRDVAGSQICYNYICDGTDDCNDDQIIITMVAIMMLMVMKMVVQMVMLVVIMITC